MTKCSIQPLAMTLVSECEISDECGIRFVILRRGDGNSPHPLSPSPFRGRGAGVALRLPSPSEARGVGGEGCSNHNVAAISISARFNSKVLSGPTALILRCSVSSGC